MTKPLKPGPITAGEKEMFGTLGLAYENGDLALVSMIRKSDQKRVSVICVMSWNADGTISPLPIAEMMDENPYEKYEDPTILE